ncbi:sugar transferase [Lentibacillus sp. CBA3610]|uniref:sugar transferase n=1 Tax=Lentibacillus sp. CBA3610 TaxID=2518176 RepID=UPI001594F728|nr:sugar transferase [Lentibacillus sp. CBA3610]QKY68268.1 sugar transferase [Lentibacillus sp. CBA3610]
MEARQHIRLQSVSVRHKQLFLIVKRLFDIIISLVCLIVLAPVLLWISYRLLKKEGRPVFFREARAGRDKRLFIRWRFRTMTNASKVIRALPPHPFPKSWSNGVPDAFHFNRESQRTVTPTGKWIQKYRLDRISELFNVLKGDMSLVGPKPEIPDIADYYNQYQKQRLQVRPGLTCFAQLNGRTNKNHAKKIRDDLSYIRNCSMKWDIIIMFRTLKQGIRNGNFSRKRLR